MLKRPMIRIEIRLRPERSHAAAQVCIARGLSGRRYRFRPNQGLKALALRAWAFSPLLQNHLPLESVHPTNLTGDFTHT